MSAASTVSGHAVPAIHTTSGAASGDYRDHSDERYCDLGSEGLIHLAKRFKSLEKVFSNIPKEHLSDSSRALCESVKTYIDIPENILSTLTKVKYVSDNARFKHSFRTRVGYNENKLKAAIDSTIKIGDANTKVKEIVDSSPGAKDALNSIMRDIPKVNHESPLTSVDRTQNINVCILACKIYDIEKTGDGEFLNYLIWKEATNIWENAPEATRGEKPGGENWGGENRYKSREILQRSVDSYNKMQDSLILLAEDISKSSTIYNNFQVALRSLFKKEIDEELPENFLELALLENPEFVEIARRVALLPEDKQEFLNWNIWDIATKRYEDMQRSRTLASDAVAPGGDNWGFKNRYTNMDDLEIALHLVEADMVSLEDRVTAENKNLLRDILYNFTLPEATKLRLLDPSPPHRRHSKTFANGKTAIVHEYDLRKFLMPNTGTSKAISTFLFYYLQEQFASIPSLNNIEIRLEDFLSTSLEYTSESVEDLIGLYDRELLKNVDFLAKDLIIIPRFSKGNTTTRRNHATLGIIDLKRKNIVYLDSSCGYTAYRRKIGNLFLTATRAHLKKLSQNNSSGGAAAVAAKIGDIRDWAIKTPLQRDNALTDGFQGVPTQTTSMHCSVFRFLYILHYALDLPYEFKEQELNKVRENIVALILSETS